METKSRLKGAFTNIFIVSFSACLAALADESMRAVPATNQLYLVISNSPTAVYLTAFNTVSNVSYAIETNSDITNPRGWGVWVTVPATNNVTPLSSMGLDFQEIFFRAVSGPAGGAQDALYLGRLDVHTSANQSSLSARLSGNNRLEKNLTGWGQIINPDGDCSFIPGKNSLVISVPGGSPHDLAAEINRTNAPRVLQEVEGDFTIQAQTDGRSFEPGEISTQWGRKSYFGAAIVVMLDSDNVVTLARAAMQSPGKKSEYYANFELRAGGNLQRIGMSGDHRLPAEGPVYLRLQRRGSEITGAASVDGTNWHSLGAKVVPSNWSGKIWTGVAAISTSETEFDPRFSGLTIGQ